MNYAGKFDATIPSDGQGGPSQSQVQVDSVMGHAPADAIVVSDAHFLFHADFKRSGLDLVLHKDDHELVLHDYFKGDKRAALASPDGAHLTGDIVNALTGSIDVAQAGGPVAAGHVIGHVTKLVGSATAIRNGVSIILNMGENVEKGDVVESGSDSTLGITFIDGTVFGLSSNARMVLNDMVYDPNGSNNSSLLSLVAGTITFVAGATAKHGDMKVDTPVATMGIRGTAVLVEIDFTVPGQGATPDAHFQVLVEPDGTTGSYILFDKSTLQPLAMVNQAGQQINISNGIISQSSAPLSPDVEKLIQDVFTLKFSANDTNPKTTTAQTDSTNPLLFAPVIKLADNTTAQPIYQNLTLVIGDPSTDPPNVLAPTVFRVPGPPTFYVFNSLGQNSTSFALTELPGKTGPTDLAIDTVGGSVRFVDPNAGDLPTVSITLDHIDYKGAVVDSHFRLVSGTLSQLELSDLQGTGITVNVVPASTNTNNGSASWTYSVADRAFDFLAAGETLVLTYTVKVDNNYAPNDQAGTATITITITGTNDAPVITTGAQEIDFSGGTSTPGGPLTSGDPLNGKLNFTDVDLDDTHKVGAKLTSVVMSDGSKVPPGPLTLFEKALTVSLESDSTGSGSGVIDWQLAQLPAYVADFIPAGQKLALTYTVTVTDSQGATADQTVTVDITGTDNKAVVWIHTTDDGSPDNKWSTAQNWETGTVPTSTDDVIIITDQLIGLTPSYPVTIDESTLAFAHSLTMNDYSGVAPELDVYGSLTISAALTLSADSILRNFGIMTVGGYAGIDSSVLENAGRLTLQGGGDFQGVGGIINDEGGTIEISGGQLIVAVNVANNGQISIDAGASLALSGKTIDGGTVSVKGASEDSDSTGTLDLSRHGVLQNGALDNSGQVTVVGPFVSMHNETVTNKGALEIVWGTLTLDQGSTVSNLGTITLDPRGGAGLVLNEATIDGGLIVNGSLIYLNGDGVLENGSLQDPDSGSVLAYGLGNSIDNETVTGLGGMLVGQDGALTIDQGSLVTDHSVDVEGTLTLDEATFDGGGVNNDAGGTIDITGSAVLKNGALLNLSQVNVSGAGNALDKEIVGANHSLEVQAGGALLIDQGTTITNSVTVPATGEDSSPSTTAGNITVDNSASLNVNDATITGGTVTNNGGTIGLTGAAVIKNGSLGNHGQLNVSGTGNVLDREGLANTGNGGIDIIGSLTLKDAASITNGESNVVTVESTGSLTLNDTSSIIGGALSNAGNVYIEASTGATFDGVTIENSSGTIHVDFAEQSAALILDDGTSITGGHLDIGSLGTLEVSTADGATLSGVTVENSGLVQVEESAVLALDGSTIDNGGLVNDGTINSTGTSAIDGAGITNYGLIASLSGTLTIDPGTLTNSGTLEANGGELDISSETVGNAGTIGATDGGTLKLISSTIDNSRDGTVTVGAGSTLDLDHSSISGGTLTISGTLDNLAGANTVTSAITMEDGGSIVISSGSLDLTGSVTGDIKLSGDATVELGASGTSAYAGTTVSFETGATGTLMLDHAESFTGTITGLGDNTIDLADICYASDPTVSYVNGVLSVFVGGVDVANLHITGDYSGVHWVLSADSSGHGTTIHEIAGGDHDNHHGLVIETDKFTITQNSDGTDTIAGLQVNDSGPSVASETFSLSASTGSASSSVSPSSGCGSLADINTDLSSITYDPTANGPAPHTDQVNVTVVDNFGARETVHFIFSEGDGSNVTLRGTSGSNVVIATGRADTLIGGGHDQFVFKPTSGQHTVQHTVVDFNTNFDTIDVRQFSNISAWTDVKASQHGSDTVLTLDSHDTILLKNVIAANLHASDFIVTPHTV